MATIAAPQFAPRAQPNLGSRFAGEVSAYRLVVTYALLFPLLFFAVRGAFSFQYANANSGEFSAYGAAVNPDAGQGSVAHSLEMIACYGIVCLAILPFWRQTLQACIENPLSLLLPLWAWTSTLWSQEPKKTFIFAIFPILCTIFGLYFSTRFKPRQQMQIIMLLGLVAMTGSLLEAAVMPGAGIDYKNSMVGLEGIYPHKNICAVATIVFMVPAFFYRFQGNWASIKRVAYIGTSLFLLLATTSRTGWLVLLATLTFIYFAKSMRRVRSIERALVLFFVPACVAFIAWLVYTFRLELLNLIGKDPTLSGRTVIWSHIFTSIFKSPWIGFGYDAFWIGLKGEAVRLMIAIGDPGLGNAENGVLQMWLELGLIGVLLLFTILFRACRNAARCFRADTPDYVLWYMTIIFMAVLAILYGDKFMIPHSVEWPLIILADAGLALQARRVQAASRS